MKTEERIYKYCPKEACDFCPLWKDEVKLANKEKLATLKEMKTEELRVNDKRFACNCKLCRTYRKEIKEEGGILSLYDGNRRIMK